jgi:hypothetical protein
MLFQLERPSMRIPCVNQSRWSHQDGRCAFDLWHWCLCVSSRSVFHFIIHALAQILLYTSVATQFAQLPHWSFHFLVSLGLSLSNTAFLIFAFRGRSHEECLRRIGQEPDESNAGIDQNYFRRVMGMKNVHIMAAFILIYVGIEVTLGGES